MQRDLRSSSTEVELLRNLNYGAEPARDLWINCQWVELECRLLEGALNRLKCFPKKPQWLSGLRVLSGSLALVRAQAPPVFKIACFKFKLLLAAASPTRTCEFCPSPIDHSRKGQLGT